MIIGSWFVAPILLRVRGDNYPDTGGLPGNVSDFIDVEISLAKAMVDCSENSRKLLLGKIPHTLRMIAKAHSVDIVLLDLNPSNCTINQVCLMGSDYFTVPFFLDYLSYRAVVSLTEMLPIWYKNLSERYQKSLSGGLTAEEVAQFKEDNKKYILPKPPKLLQLIPQRYDLARRTPPEPTKVCVKVRSDIYEKANKDLIPLLRDHNMLSNGFELARLTGIPNYWSLGLRAQESGDPVCNIPYEHMPTKTSQESHAHSKLFYRNLFIEIINDMFDKFRKDHFDLTNPRQYELAVEKWPTFELEALALPDIKRKKKRDPEEEKKLQARQDKRSREEGQSDVSRRREDVLNTASTATFFSTRRGESEKEESQESNMFLDKPL